MMEKRNFVTSMRTPMEGAADIDDIIAAGTKAMGVGMAKAAGAKESDRLRERAIEEDEKSDALEF